MQSKTCPECGDPISLTAKAHRCGWREIEQSPKRADPMHLICEFVTDGQRCAEYGGISTNTHGGGPWYCRKHYDVVTGRGEHQVAVRPPHGFAPLKAVLQRKFQVEREPGMEE